MRFLWLILYILNFPNPFYGKKISDVPLIILEPSEVGSFSNHPSEIHYQELKDNEIENYLTEVFLKDWDDENGINKTPYLEVDLDGISIKKNPKLKPIISEFSNIRQNRIEKLQRLFFKKFRVKRDSRRASELARSKSLEASRSRSSSYYKRIKDQRQSSELSRLRSSSSSLSKLRSLSSSSASSSRYYGRLSDQNKKWSESRSQSQASSLASREKSIASLRSRSSASLASVKKSSMSRASESERSRISKLFVQSRTQEIEPTRVNSFENPRAMKTRFLPTFRDFLNQLWQG